MIVKGQKRQENILYAVLWTLLFTAPVLSMCFDAIADGSGYDWPMLWNTWGLLLFFLTTFVLHNLLLAPMLVYGSKRWQYFALLAVLLVCFELYQCNARPHIEPHDGRPPHEQRDAPRQGSLQDRLTHQGNQFPSEGETPPPPPHGERPGKHKGEPPLVFGGENMVAFLIMSMLLGLNVAAKYYFKSLDERKRMRELEYENMHQKLESLTYQINPHFFMNTLNNIHALVAFDPDKAETTIEALSDLMRHVLYEAGKKLVPLQKEVDFLRNYIDIERIRWADAVRIDVSLPTQVPDVRIPPMLFITFVENAFKHGLSYERPSFVEVSMTVEGEHVGFSCRNSRKPASEDSHGGVGLENVTKRLRLIYGSDFKLIKRATSDEYSVQLVIPFDSKQ